MEILQSIGFLHFFYQVGSVSQWILERKSWTLQRCKFLELYTIVIVFGSIAFLLYGLFTNDEFIKNSDNEIGQMVDFIQMCGIRLAHIVSITESIVRRNEQRNFYEKVSEIDRIFECSLNIDINNKMFQRKTFQRFGIMFGLYIASEVFILMTKLIAVEKHFALYWIFYLLPLMVCGLRYFQIFTLVMIIKKRFDTLIEVLDQISLSEKNEKMLEVDLNAQCIQQISANCTIFDATEQLKRRNYIENDNLKRVLVVRDLYNRLWELTSLLNKGYGVSILLNVGNDFISITSNCYWIFLNFKEYSRSVKDGLLMAGSAVWTVPHLFNVLVLAIICDRTVQTKTGIALSLHKIEIDISNSNHNSVVEQFSLQLLHQKMCFTAAGFFNVDCTLLYTIVGATTTYLIILIQFHMTEASNTA